MKILNFGSCNIDTVYRLPHITLSGETNIASSVSSYPGGKGLNQSVALARAGLPVLHAGKVGEDGGMLTDFMHSVGIDTSLLRTVKTETGRAIIQVDDAGANAIFVLHGANFLFTREEIDEILSHFSAGDLLTVQNEINEVAYIIRRAAEKGMKVFYNPSPFNERVAEVDLSCVHCLVVNELEAGALLPGTAERTFLSAMREKYPSTNVLLTLGGRGCRYEGEEGTFSSPAFRVAAVDTTAAGDTFTGYFIASYARGVRIPAALRTASIAAALAVSKKGAASSIPAMAEVKAAERELTPASDQGGGLTAEITAYLHANLKTGTLTDFAKASGYTPAYLGKALHHATGHTFRELLTAARCERAAELLVTTDLPIGEIISQLGYENGTHFRTLFLRTYGEKPLEYRKKRRNT